MLTAEDYRKFIFFLIKKIRYDNEKKTGKTVKQESKNENNTEDFRYAQQNEKHEVVKRIVSQCLNDKYPLYPTKKVSYS